VEKKVGKDNKISTKHGTARIDSNYIPKVSRSKLKDLA
jgi:hypothetical protein